ncbi:uncharacterized protein B4U80_04478 [Leptotrombidium deliense]|uniref:Ig-like domain-containing protein n=1 Tax=Leptotrombidium deliense TaxID=299467 RepID=A0A443SWJ4_9ACAR|nr:uncharacterized protein B4U80_04478 [Leptotrombidium deliense]
MRFHSLLAAMECLRLNKLDVPPAIYQGSPVLLHCDFDVEGDALYSVKWYKDYVEFYRFIPSDIRNKGRKFHSKGVYVDLSVSNDTHVFLSKTDSDSEGIYACEVSSEFPSFITIRVERQMKVYVEHTCIALISDQSAKVSIMYNFSEAHQFVSIAVLPQESLQIEGIHESVISRNVGELINLTCSSGASRPRVRLSWFINEQMAQPHQVLRYSPQVYSNGLQSTRLGLTFLVTADHFNKGVLLLRCSATVVLAYKFETSLQLIGGQRPKQSHGKLQILLMCAQINCNLAIESSDVKEEEAPIIVGAKSWYAVGEPMDLNCTTNARDSLLRWFINEDEVNKLLTFNI